MIRMEIACFVILAFVAIIYFSAGVRTARLYKTYSALLITMLVHLVFDGVTVYTANRLDTVPLFLNDTLHRIYLGTMVLVVYLFFRYVSLLVSEETGEKPKFNRAATVFLIFSELCVALLPVNYEECGGCIDNLKVSLYQRHESKESEKGEERVIHSITRFLQENAVEDITLAALAERFNLNAQYISQLFKNEIGVGFHAYLTNVRCGNYGR